ncbi:MAG: serine/threonine protein kinase [Planctomycetes bacterium]|nr:serine/threonine protein kinase [Planctomycetota bacterium]
MLDESQRERLRTLFSAGVDRPPSQRAAFVAAACPDDPEVRRELAELLDVADSGGADAVTMPVSLPLTPGASDPAVGPGGSGQTPRIAGYEQFEAIAEGGMGEVYRAQQLRPVRRTVAIKVIKKGMESEAVLRRFEAEQQALALMNHPYVAKVHDAGRDDAGRPFLVMEFVSGVPINEFCERERLSLDDRLQLFCKICHAVEHAHRRGVLHRDLKPSNILVERVGDEVLPKVIDFGIAKALQGPLGEQSIHTVDGSMLGTPEYMSPEQVLGAVSQIDTRTDVYALGVILYELVTGELPFPSERLREAGIYEFGRMVREEVPPKPSRRTHSGAGQGVAASHTAQWARRLTGDLDWIVMQAIDKEPDRRYDSPRALAVDVENFLLHRPVSAGPPTATYRLRKFVRRYRFQVASTALVLASVLVGGGVAAWLAVQNAALASEKGEVAAREAEERRKAVALAEEKSQLLEQQTALVADLETVSSFQAGLLSELDQGGLAASIRAGVLEEARNVYAASRFEDSAARMAQLEDLLAGVQFPNLALKTLQDNLFDPALATLDKDFADRPQVRARLLHAIGWAQEGVGLLDQAEQPLRQSLAIWREQLGDEHIETLRAWNHLGLLLTAKAEHEEAEVTFRTVSELRGKVLGADHPDTLQSLHDLANLLKDLGRLEEAQTLCERVLRDRRRVLGDDDVETVRTQANLAFILIAREDFAAARPLLEDIVGRSRAVFGDSHPDVMLMDSQYGTLLGKLGERQEAERYLRQAAEGARSLLGNDHYYTLAFANNHASLLQDLGRFDEAQRVLVEAAAGARRVFGARHPNTLIVTFNLANVLRRLGRHEEAAPHYRAAHEGAVGLYGPDSPQALQMLNGLALNSHQNGDLDEAERAYLEVLERARTAFGPTHPRVLQVMNALGGLCEMRGQYEEAVVRYREVLAIREAAGNDDEDVLTVVHNLGSALGQAGQGDEAEAMLRRAVTGRERLLGKAHPDTGSSYYALATMLPGRGHPEEAQVLIRAALTGWTEVFGMAHEKTAKAAIAYAQIAIPLLDSGAVAADALQVLASHESGVREVESGTRLARFLHGLGRLRVRQGGDEQSASLLAAGTRNLLQAEATLAAADDLRPGELGNLRTSIARAYSAWQEVAPRAGHQQRAEEWAQKAAATPR